MAAPSITDGMRRTIEVLARPSAAILGLVIGLKAVYGPQEAGFAFLALSVLPLFWVYSAAKYWNSWYAAGFIAVGFMFWATLPGIGQYLVPPAFVQAVQVLELLFLLGIGMLLKNKLDWF